MEHFFDTADLAKQLNVKEQKIIDAINWKQPKEGFISTKKGAVFLGYQLTMNAAKILLKEYNKYLAQAKNVKK